MSEVKSVKSTKDKQTPYQRDNRAMVNKRTKLERHCKKHHGDVQAHAALGSFTISGKSSRHGYKGPKRGLGNPSSGRLVQQLRKKIKNLNSNGFVVPEHTK